MWRQVYGDFPRLHDMREEHWAAISRRVVSMGGAVTAVYDLWRRELEDDDESSDDDDVDT